MCEVTNIIIIITIASTTTIDINSNNDDKDEPIIYRKKNQDHLGYSIFGIGQISKTPGDQQLDSTETKTF